MMKKGKIILIIAAFLMALPAVIWASAGDSKKEATDAQKAVVAEEYGKLPLYFIENDGQVDQKVKYYERGSGHSTFFTQDGVYLSLIKTTKKQEEEKGAPDKFKDHMTVEKNMESELIRLSFINGKELPEIKAEGVQEGKVNYFIGNDPSKWRTNVSTWSAVRYKEIYEGIDIRFYGSNRQLEYDLIVSPGADPGAARLAYSGIEGLKVTEDGELEIALKEGKIIQRKPYIYQEIEGERKVIEGRFRINQASLRDDTYEYGFEVASYDRKYPLVIDPVLVYSTYLGGSGNDYGHDIAVDGSGNAYVTGDTNSTNFPIAAAYQGSNAGGWDVFVTKLNAAGSALIYSSYLGGSGNDYVFGIAADGSGNAYVTGYTNSTNFPTASAYQGTYGGGINDTFVTKLNAAGSALVYSTYLGGSGNEYGYGIAADGSGNAYVTGWTYSTNFPVYAAYAYQGSNAGGADGFVTKLNASGLALVYSTYLGGSSNDWGYGIAVDGSGNAYVTGSTGSTDFPTVAAYQGSNAGGGDGFVTKLNASGLALVYSTYLGGSGGDVGYRIAADGWGNAYVTGYTDSTNFPTAAAYQGSNAGGWDGFVTKLNAAGSALIYSSYLGGNSEDRGYGIAADGSGNAYVTGYTYSTNFPTAAAYQGSNAGGADGFVTKLNAAGSALIYSTYLGGSGGDVGYGIAADGWGNAYVTGQTNSTNFPTASAYQGSNAWGWDVFVTKISEDLADITTVNAGSGLTGGGTSGPVTLSVDFAYLDNVYVNRTGDTMTGTLTVVGVIESTSGGIKYPDGTIQTTASGQGSTTAESSFYGYNAGVSTTGGSSNTMMGANAGYNQTFGNGNTFIGYGAGYSNDTGSWNVFIGNGAGYNETGSQKLYIANSSTSSPLIYGEFDNGFVEVNGDLYVTGNTYVDSDESLKRDIHPIDSALSKISEIEGVSYTRKKDDPDTNSRHYGVIAQQVEEVLPEIVKKGDDEIRKVAYMELIPVLIEAVKQLKEENNQMSKRITELERELNLKGSIAMADVK